MHADMSDPSFREEGSASTGKKGLIMHVIRVYLSP